jgi:cobalt-zinc-cadmium efflux system outer membrane protein
MRVRVRVAALGVVWLGAAGEAQAQTVLTLPEVLARARERAPEITSARLALDEVRTRLLGASLRFQSNPELDLSVGRRRGSGEGSTDVEIGFSQLFEPGTRRAARTAGAEAAIALGTAEVDEAIRVVLRAAASSYYRALHAAERVRLLGDAGDLAARVYAVADVRFKAGDLAVLDVNIARASLARVRAEREAAEATHALAIGELRQLLRIDDEVVVRGELSPQDDATLGDRLTSAERRPDVVALEAAVRDAAAERQLAQTLARPEYAVGARYKREDGDQIVLGGLTLTLPIFAKGQETRAATTARIARLQAALDAARQRARLEVRATFDAWQKRRQGVRLLETAALPGLDENDALTTRSFEVGQLGLPELLAIRREILETRFQYLDARLEAALARLDLDAAAAVLR